METVMVNARVPRAKKEASACILDQLGVTTSDLINSAYDYLLVEHRLPAPGSSANTPCSSEEDAAKFAQFVQECTLDVSWPEDGVSCVENSAVEDPAVEEGRGAYEPVA